MEDKVIALAALFDGDQDHVRDEISRVAAELGLVARDLERAVRFVAEQEVHNPHLPLRFTIPGDPPVAKRPRASRVRNKEGAVVGIRVHAEDAEDQRTVRAEILRRLPEDHVPFGGEVELSLEIFRPMLASWSPYKRLLAELGYIRADRRPDWDNFAKLVTDAMRGIVFVDDSLVVVGSVTLRYSSRPRTEVTVSGRSRSITK